MDGVRLFHSEITFEEILTAGNEQDKEREREKESEIETILVLVYTIQEERPLCTP